MLEHRHVRKRLAFSHSKSCSCENIDIVFVYVTLLLSVIPTTVCYASTLLTPPILTCCIYSSTSYQLDDDHPQITPLSKTKKSLLFLSFPPGIYLSILKTLFLAISQHTLLAWLSSPPNLYLHIVFHCLKIMNTQLHTTLLVQR